MPQEVQQNLIEMLDDFVAKWLSHGRRVIGAAVILHDRFIVASGILQSGGVPSGCSIDSLTHAIEKAAISCGVRLESPLKIFYRADDMSISAVPRGVFRRLVRSGKISFDTPVFDLSVSDLGVLRERFENAFGRSWHARVFKQTLPV